MPLRAASTRDLVFAFMGFVGIRFGFLLLPTIDVVALHPQQTPALLRIVCARKKRVKVGKVGRPARDLDQAPPASARKESARFRQAVFRRWDMMSS